MSGKHTSLPSTITVHVPLTFTVRGGRKTVIGTVSRLAHATPRTRFDDSIIKALARAYRWKKKLEDSTYETIGELAKAKGLNESYLTRILRLNFLAPDIVEAALNGQTTLTVQRLSERRSPMWHEQRSDLAARLISSPR